MFHMGDMIPEKYFEITGNNNNKMFLTEGDLLYDYFHFFFSSREEMRGENRVASNYAQRL